MSTQVKDFECCPPFDPVPWDDKLFEWDNKLFIKGKVYTLFFVPLNFGSVMRKLNSKIDNAKTEMLDWMSLSDHTSKWNMDLYLAVSKEIPTAENVKFSGKFYSRVYEGNFNETGKWTADFEEKAKTKGLSTGKQYFWYTTCPKCAKKYGKNYVVIIGKI